MVSRKELRELKKYLDLFYIDFGGKTINLDSDLELATSYLARNAFLLEPLGFDHFKYLSVLFDHSDIPFYHEAMLYSKELFVRKQSGAWIWFEGILEGGRDGKLAFYSAEDTTRIH